VRLGVPLLDEYLEFLAGRCRPNMVLAVAYDLKVFFTVVGKPPRRVRPVDVLAFMTAQRSGGEGRLQIAGAGDAGVSTAGRPKWPTFAVCRAGSIRRASLPSIADDLARATDATALGQTLTRRPIRL